MIVAQTAFQLDAGVELSTGEIVGPVAGFLALAAIASWMLARLLRHIAETPEAERETVGMGTPIAAD
jgi:hypothetical protein